MHDFHFELILLIFLSVASRGAGILDPVIVSTTFFANLPEILIVAIPDVQDPDDNAYIVILLLYI